MLDWLFGRRKPVHAPEVQRARAERDALFADADATNAKAKAATKEVDRLQDDRLDDYEDAERARRKR